MLKKKHILVILTMALFIATALAGGPVKAANGDWTLVWSDEFNQAAGSSVNTSNWNIEVNSAPPNGELEAYVNSTNNIYIATDPSNANNGLLVLKATTTGGSPAYNSGRINTQGKHEFTYGKFEMRAKLPYGQGIWPAFWLLGNNYPTAGWPNCGEQDIMEFVGSTPSKIYGTLHGPQYNGGTGLGAWHNYAPGFTSDWHTYSFEWEPNICRWYFDGQLYEQRTIDDLCGMTWVFDHPFFIILNLAIGGAWPGSPDGTTVFPQYYYIDYVRVYQRQGAVYPALPYRNLLTMKSASTNQFVCCDNYASPAGILVANRDSASTWETYEQIDLGNGNVAFICLQDYKYITLSGSSQLSGQSETIGNNETFQLISNADGTKSLKNVGNGKYVTVDANKNMFATATSIGTAEKFTFTYKPSGNPGTPSPSTGSTPTPTPSSGGAKIIPGTIEAESYNSMSGVQTETCSEGGSDVAYIDAGDYMNYNVNVQTAGTYTVSFRVASPYANTQLQLKNGSTVLATVTLPNTGGYQTWATATATVTLAAGSQTLQVYAVTNGWNFNWMSFALNGSSTPTPVATPTATKTPTATPVSGKAIPGKIEAESYDAMYGIQLETCSEGGQDVSYVDAGDYMNYNVTVQTTKAYTVQFRVSSPYTGTQIQLKSGSTVLTTVTVPNTGGWQTWQTVSATVNLTAGSQTLQVYAPTNGWNLNWINFQ